jgi:zinc protease
VLSEKRVRDTYELRDYLDGVQFFYPGARFLERLPIGTSKRCKAPPATSCARSTSASTAPRTPR